MRLRNIPGADEAIANCPYCIHNPAELAGSWQSIFAAPAPLHIEIGMGKGQFLMAMAEAHPDVNYLGMELYTSVLLRATQKLEANPLPNLRLLNYDAKNIGELFAPGELDRIYLNFSDPWPKDRHSKRRLTSSVFLDRYYPILKDGGLLEFKTDNQGLFTFSIEEIDAADGWELIAVTRDLHHDEALCQGNIMTEYEEKFSSQGNPICKLIARKV